MKHWLVSASLTVAALLTSSSAHADPLRLLVAVSTASGAPGELPLHHAADDARQVKTVLTSLGGFTSENAILLTDPTLGELEATLARVRGLAQAHRPEEVTFVFYFSGHGDRERIHLGGEALDVATLAAEVRAVPAGLRVLVTDACRTYPTRMKGATTEPGFAITSPSSAPGSGVVWLFASGDGEPAQESDELHGALFTHYWVDALRGAGDSNGDGRVTVAESYDFAYSQTLLRSARSSGVLQHPAAIFDLRQAAPVFLTNTSDGHTALRFPPGADTRYLVYAIGSRVVVGELWASAERDMVLALPPGRYLVERRAGETAAALEITVTRGVVRSLGAADFRLVPGEQLASKGGEMVLRPDELSIAGGVRTSRLVPLQAEGTARYAHVWGRWALEAGFTAGHGEHSTSAEHVTLSSYAVDAALGPRVRAGDWTFSFALGAQASLLHESLLRTDAARLAGVYPTGQSDVAFAPGAELRAGARYALSSAFWTKLEGSGALLFPKLDGSIGPYPEARATVGVGVSF